MLYRLYMIHTNKNGLDSVTFTERHIVLVNSSYDAQIWLNWNTLIKLAVFKCKLQNDCLSKDKLNIEYIERKSNRCLHRFLSEIKISFLIIGHITSTLTPTWNQNRY